MNKDISKLTYGWKVCKLVNGKLSSAVMWSVRAVDYSQEGWIKPSPTQSPFLFVFTKRQQARDFAIDEYGRDAQARKNVRILRVEIQRPHTENKFNDGDKVTTAEFPTGTVFVDALRIVRETRTAYKLVRTKGGGRLVSAVKASDYEPKRVEYKVGEWAKPNPGQNPYLFVFDSAENAFKFRSTRMHKDRYKIFEAEAEPCRAPKLPFVPPQGTIFASRVKLVKEIV